MDRVENGMVLGRFPYCDEYERDGMDDGDLMDMAYEHWRDEIR